jgi:predicted nucleic acid-binding protein
VIAAALQTVREKGFWVRPTETIKACSDSDDDIFLECAHAACAYYLVTGNLKHFPSSWANTLVVTPRRFLELQSADAGPTHEPLPS